MKKALDKVCADCEAACQALYASMEALCTSTTCLKCVEKQAELLEQCGALILLKKAQAVENLKKLEHLKIKVKSSEVFYSKKLYYKSSDANPSSSNTQVVSSNSAISVSSPNILNEVDLSDLSYFLFWDFFLANFFFSEVADSLALNALSSRGRTP